MRTHFFSALVAALLLVAAHPHAAAQSAAAATRPTDLQALIDASPSGIIQIPAGNYTINRALKITRDGTELHGPARILQANAAESFLRIENAGQVRVTNLAFSRTEGNQEAGQAGIEIIDCRDVELAQLRISENHTKASILARSSRDVVIHGCTIINYKGPTIDDRRGELYGYAFRSVDGTGIQYRDVDGGAIRDNRIQEFRLLPTKEVRAKYELGNLTVVPAKPGRLMPQDVFDTKYTNNWHQGAGIQVTGPRVSQRIIITGNYIQNAAQGLDLHADYMTVSNNIISHAMIGMKAMHGSKHVLIDGNQFTHVDLWGLLLMPGAASQGAANASGGNAAIAENVDGGTVVSNNIFSDFGYGEQHWNWVDRKSEYPERNVIAILFGQLEENPSIRNILITGNVVHDSGQDKVLLDGKWAKSPPRFNYALYVEQKRSPAPINVRAFGNLFDKGISGFSNFPEADPEADSRR